MTTLKKIKEPIKPKKTTKILTILLTAISTFTITFFPTGQITKKKEFENAISSNKNKQNKYLKEKEFEITKKFQKKQKLLDKICNILGVYNKENQKKLNIEITPENIEKLLNQTFKNLNEVKNEIENQKKELEKKVKECEKIIKNYEADIATMQFALSIKEKKLEEEKIDQIKKIQNSYRETFNKTKNLEKVGNDIDKKYKEINQKEAIIEQLNQKIKSLEEENKKLKENKQ